MEEALLLQLQENTTSSAPNKCRQASVSLPAATPPRLLLYSDGDELNWYISGDQRHASKSCPASGLQRCAGMTPILPISIQTFWKVSGKSKCPALQGTVLLHCCFVSLKTVLQTRMKRQASKTMSEGNMFGSHVDQRQVMNSNNAPNATP